MIGKHAEIFLLACTLFAISCVRQGIRGGREDPFLVVDSDMHDFGTISEEGKVEVIFWVANKGGKALEVYRIQPSCGCTAAMMDTQTINPGEASRLKVTYDPRGKYGRQSRNLVLFTNDPIYPQKQLSITADVVAPIGRHHGQKSGESSSIMHMSTK